MFNDYSSALMSNQDKSGGIYSFTPDDLFDRIINLKLTTKSTKLNTAVDTYVIRSDWEVYYPEIYKIVQNNGGFGALNNYYIRRCVKKPSIKVIYKQIASGTAIEIDIFVTNFMMLSNDGRTFMSFNNLTYPLGQVEIQMGYWGQFNRKPVNIEQLFDFKSNKNADTILINVDYVQTDKLPPDAVMHIHGYVGSCYNPPVATGDSFNASYDNIKDANKLTSTGDIVQDYIFNNITRRFIRGNLPKVPIVPDPTTGLMSVADAEVHGVKVYLSEKLEKECLKHWQKKLKKENKEPTDIKVVGHYSETVVKALNLMRDELGIDLSFKELIDGNYIAYLMEESEDTKSLSEGLARYKLTDKDIRNAGSVISTIYKNELPAVENITTDALCTIVCPFFYFLNPFDLIKFKSRYALGGIVSYYANFSAQESRFYALYMTVSFATEDNINECNIICTGSVE